MIDLCLRGAQVVVARKRAAFIIACLIVMIGVGFQNCAQVSLSSFSRHRNGEPYDGKVYASRDLCSDQKPATMLQLTSPLTALLLKSNCQVMDPPTLLTAGQFVFWEISPETVVIGTQTLYAQPPVNNAISFMQKIAAGGDQTTTTWSVPSLPNPTQAGDFVVCFVVYSSDSIASPVVTQLTDDQQNTYRQALQPFKPQAGQRTQSLSLEIWYAENINGGPSLATTAQFSSASATNGNWKELQCLNYRGVSLSGALEQVRTGSGPATDLARISLIEPASSNAVIVSAFFSERSVASASSAATVRSTDIGHLFQDFITTSLGIFDAVADIGAIADWMGAALVFRGAP